jgi:hypothetical protein
MGQQAGPARAAGRLAPPATGRVIPRQRKVRVETRTGIVRAKKDAGTPAVELELGGSERLLDFVIDFHRPSPLAPLADQLAYEKRKTIDWSWEATVEVELPLAPASRRKTRRSTGNANGSHRGRKAGS